MAAMDVAVAGSNKPSNETSTYSRWSDLPPELAGLVLDRLQSNVDRIRFSSVCRYWRHGVRQWSSPAPAPPFPPWINLLDKERTFQSFRSGKLHTRIMPGTPQNGIWLGCSDNWLLFFKPWNRRFPYSLENPLAGAVLTLPGSDRSGHGSFRRMSIHSFIVCSGDLVIASVETEDSAPAIACCRQGPRCSSWSVRPYDAGGEANRRYRYRSIAFHHGKLYGLNSKGSLFVHDVIVRDADDDEQEEEDTPPPALSPGRKLIDGIPYHAEVHLVAMTTSSTGGHGMLLMVRRTTTTEPVAFKLRVLEADLETNQWKKMESSEDDNEVLFVSEKFSKVVSAGSHGGYGLRRNHIYYMDYGCPTIRCGMYDLRNDTFDLILPSSDHMRDAAWFFPRV